MSKHLYPITTEFFPVKVFFAPVESAWESFLIKELDLSLDNGPDFPQSKGRTTLFEHDTTGNNIIVVTINPDRLEAHTHNEIMGILVHEAVHVFDFCMEYMGEDSPGSEIKAYIIQYIFLQLVNAYEDMKSTEK